MSKYKRTLLTTQVPVTVPMSGPAQRCPSVMLTPYFSEYSREQSDVLPTLSTACNQGRYMILIIYSSYGTRKPGTDC